jgi:hypothetical protein
MLEDRMPISCTRQLEELRADAGFLKVVDLVTKEVMRHWNASHQVAHGFVLSAIGEPATLSTIYQAWSLAKHSGEGLGLAKLIVRRRVVDLLRKDARRTEHSSLPAPDGEKDKLLGEFNDLVQRNPQVQLELQEIIQMVRSALACFARQGWIQQRQAQLLQRYALEEASYGELSAELACSENALRVRVHKAMHALRKHIRECHADLEHLLERDRPGDRSRKHL